ncbi:MAG: hypothetical protein HGA45_01040 [Chloroflexales bacterium]|nr:hypothetical protein [Chloroflexales bacterium]
MNPITLTTARSRARSQALRLAGLAVIIVVILAAAVAVMVREPAVAHTSISQSPGAVTRADVTIEMGAGVLRLGALTAGDALLSGTLDYPTHEHIARQFVLSDGIATYDLRSQAIRPGWPAGWLYPVEQLRWDLGLSSETPLNLAVQVGVGDAQLDLAELHLEQLRVQSGIGTTTLTLPRSGQVRAEVKGSSGDTIITIPAGVAVSIRAQDGGGAVTLVVNGHPRRLPYISPNYTAAANRVALTVIGGMGVVALHVNV